MGDQVLCTLKLDPEFKWKRSPHVKFNHSKKIVKQTSPNDLKDDD